MSWLRRWWVPLALFAAGAIAFCAVAGSRLGRQSTDPHFSFLAAAWLDGRVAIDPPPQKGDDWAKVETVRLDDGSEVRGRRLTTRKTFRIAGGGEVPLARIERSLGMTHYVSFPPFPAALMVPQAAIHGDIANDVGLTILIAALVLPLAFFTLRRLVAAGLSNRTVGDDVWLVVALTFGSVFFFSAVQGRVWFTAHIVGVALALGYAWCSIEARRPILAGVLLGLATMTRTPLAFMFPLFAFEAWRVAGGWTGDRRRLVRLSVRFAVPVVAIAIVAMFYNYARFDDPLEFGHSYLAVKQQQQMETIGMFSVRYLSRNLSVAMTLLPDISTAAPYVSINGHGLAMWFTTPVLLYVLWPRRRGHIHRALWATVALVALPTLLYQNSGWLQFGYRFALDYLPFLVLLLAVGGRPLTRVAKAQIVIGVIINLFGAVTFARHHQFYRADNSAYSCVVRH